MDVTPSQHEIALLRKELELQRKTSEIESMRLELDFVKRNRDARLELSKRDAQLVSTRRDAQLESTRRDAEEQRLRFEKRETELHMLYLFHSEKARVSGRAALAESVKREAERRKHESLLELVDKNDKIIRNTNDIAPAKVNYVGIVGDGRGRFKTFRQQRETMDKNYGFVVRDRDGKRELLNPNSVERRYESEWVVYGDPIGVAHGVDLWNAFRMRNAASFGLDFDDTSSNEFRLLNEAEVRERYKFFAAAKNDDATSQFDQDVSHLRRSLRAD